MGRKFLPDVPTTPKKTGGGRGSNNRTAADDAEGPHTVINERGSTTYDVNDHTPNKNSKGKGFETKKRVDYEGAAHKNKKGERIENPHVKEKIRNKKGKIEETTRPAIPGKDMPKKS